MRRNEALLAPPAPELPSLARDARAIARTEGVTKTYGRDDLHVRALDDVSVEIPAGRFTAIMGPSGSGKSTLMHCLAGLDSPDSGRVLIEDTDLGGLSDRELTRLRRDRIGFIFQAFNLIPTLTAAENITLPLDLARSRPEPAWFDRVVSTVGLRPRLTHRPSELSGGQQQRVAVARALVGRPAIVFADEPTGNLDSSSGGQILTFMRDAVDELSQSIVMVTHDAIAASYTDQVLFLVDGRIVDRMEEPSVDRVLEAMKSMGD